MQTGSMADCKRLLTFTTADTINHDRSARLSPPPEGRVSPAPALPQDPGPERRAAAAAPLEVAEAIAFLAWDRASAIHGSEIVVDSVARPRSTSLQDALRLFN